MVVAYFKILSEIFVEQLSVTAKTLVENNCIPGPMSGAGILRKRSRCANNSPAKCGDLPSGLRLSH